MQVQAAAFIFKNWDFFFIPVEKEVFQGRQYTLWHVIIEHNGKMYQTFYLAFVPSAKICRRIKKNKTYLKSKI